MIHGIELHQVEEEKEPYSFKKQAAFSILKWVFMTKKPLSAAMVGWYLVGATL
jgi:hypothetical protein